MIWGRLLTFILKYGTIYQSYIQLRALITQSNLSSYGTAMTAIERKSDLKLTTDTPYLALTGKLWGVYYVNFEDWPRYNGTALYLEAQHTCWWSGDTKDQGISKYDIDLVFQDIPGLPWNVRKSEYVFDFISYGHIDTLWWLKKVLFEDKWSLPIALH